MRVSSVCTSFAQMMRLRSKTPPRPPRFIMAPQESLAWIMSIIRRMTATCVPRS
jgi:hypothetical protein